jgi:threonine dehydratase
LNNHWVICLCFCWCKPNIVLKVLGEMASCPGDLSTVQGGLACGEVSPIAYTILRGGVDHFATVDDSCVAPSLTLLANANPAIAVGESAIAGLAVAAALVAPVSAQLDMAQPPPQPLATRPKAVVGRASRVVVIACEGPTSPLAFEHLTGKKLAELAASPFVFPPTQVESAKY